MAKHYPEELELWPPDREPDNANHGAGHGWTCSYTPCMGVRDTWSVEDFERCARHPPPGYTLREPEPQWPEVGTWWKHGRLAPNVATRVDEIGDGNSVGDRVWASCWNSSLGKMGGIAGRANSSTPAEWHEHWSPCDPPEGWEDPEDAKAAEWPEDGSWYHTHDYKAPCRFSLRDGVPGYELWNQWADALMPWVACTANARTPEDFWAQREPCDSPPQPRPQAALPPTGSGSVKIEETEFKVGDRVRVVRCAKHAHFSTIGPVERTIAQIVDGSISEQRLARFGEAEGDGVYLCCLQKIGPEPEPEYRFTCEQHDYGSNNPVCPDCHAESEKRARAVIEAEAAAPFKVGDIVRHRHSGGLLSNATAVVDKVTPAGYAFVLLDDGSRLAFCAEDLKLVTQAKEENVSEKARIGCMSRDGEYVLRLADPGETTATLGALDRLINKELKRDRSLMSRLVRRPAAALVSKTWQLWLGAALLYGALMATDNWDKIQEWIGAPVAVEAEAEAEAEEQPTVEAETKPVRFDTIDDATVEGPR